MPNVVASRASVQVSIYIHANALLNAISIWTNTWLSTEELYSLLKYFLCERTVEVNITMCVENRKPIHFLKMNPRAWMDASLPKFKATVREVAAQTPLTKKELQEMPWSQRHDHLNSYAFKRQERRWEDEVGIKPEDSYFTLIVPIHNEESSLPSFLKTLMLSDIPSSVNLNIVFIT